MVVYDMQKEIILVSFGCEGDAIKSTEFDSSFDFVFILKVDYFFKDTFEEIIVFDHVKDGLIGE